MVVFNTSPYSQEEGMISWKHDMQFLKKGEEEIAIIFTFIFIFLTFSFLF